MWRSKHRISEAAKRTKEKKRKRDRIEHVIRYHSQPNPPFMQIRLPSTFDILSKKKYPPKTNNTHIMIFFTKPSSSGLAAALGRFPYPALDSSAPFLCPVKSSDRDLPPGEMNDPVDTYASCMQDQLNR